MKKVVMNIMVMTVLMLPCCLVFSDALTMQFLGAVYCFGYWQNIGKPLYDEYRRLRRSDEKEHYTAV